jgi:N-acetyltransferase
MLAEKMNHDSSDPAQRPSGVRRGDGDGAAGMLMRQQYRRWQDWGMVATRPSLSTLTGSHIELVPLVRSDLPELWGAIGTPDVFAGGWGGGPAGYPGDKSGFVAFGENYFSWDTNNVYGVRLTDGRLVGTSTLGDFDLTLEHAHIGWTAYSPSVWGTVVNPEAKLLMLEHAFSNGIGRVKLQADSINHRSRAAILKLGATFEGIVRRERPRADGTWRDTALYSILIDEWPTVKQALELRIAATSL